MGRRKRKGRKTAIETKTDQQGENRTKRGEKRSGK